MPGWAKNEDVRSGWLLGLMYTPLLLEWSSIALEGGGGRVLVDVVCGTSGTFGGATLTSSVVFCLGCNKIKN